MEFRKHILETLNVSIYLYSALTCVDTLRKEILTENNFPSELWGCHMYQCLFIFHCSCCELWFFFFFIPYLIKIFWFGFPLIFYTFTVIFFHPLYWHLMGPFNLEGNSCPSMWDIFLNHFVNCFFLSSFLFSLESIFFDTQTVSCNFVTYSLVF